jgi:hypothetical protein
LARVSAASAPAVTRSCRAIKTVLVANPATAVSTPAATTVAVTSTTLCRRANFQQRYPVDGGHACTASSLR